MKRILSMLLLLLVVGACTTTVKAAHFTAKGPAVSSSTVAVAPDPGWDD